MLIQTRHIITYRYSDPVFLEPHIARLTPRGDAAQRPLEDTLAIDPEPTGVTPMLDHDGNRVTRMWFEGLTRELRVEAHARVPRRVRLGCWCCL